MISGFPNLAPRLMAEILGSEVDADLSEIAARLAKEQEDESAAWRQLCEAFTQAAGRLEESDKASAFMDVMPRLARFSFWLDEVSGRLNLLERQIRP
jgi:hypothetical protein